MLNQKRVDIIVRGQKWFQGQHVENHEKQEQYWNEAERGARLREAERR